MLAFIYADISNEDYFINFNRCQSEKAKEAKWILRYENASFYLSQSEYQIISQIHEKIGKNHKYDQVSIEEIEQALLRKKNTVFTLTQILKRLNFDSSINILKKAYMFLNKRNIGAFEKEIEKLIYKPTYFKSMNYSSSEQVKEYKELIKKINKLNPNNKLFNIYLIKELNQVDEEFKAFYTDYIEISQAEYLSNLNSPRYALVYPDVWIKWAYNHLKPNVFYKQFEKIKFDKLPLSQLISFEYYRGLSDKHLKKYVPTFKKLKNSSKYWERNLFYQIIDNPNLQKDLNKLKTKLVPSISQRRGFYRDSLLEMHSINDNVYSLFSLGDIQYEYFISALAVRSYGLPSTKFLQVK